MQAEKGSYQPAIPAQEARTLTVQPAAVHLPFVCGCERCPGLSRPLTAQPYAHDIPGTRVRIPIATHTRTHMRMRMRTHTGLLTHIQPGISRDRYLVSFSLH